MRKEKIEAKAKEEEDADLGFIPDLANIDQLAQNLLPTVKKEDLPSREEP